MWVWCYGTKLIAGETLQLVAGSRQFGSQPSPLLPLLPQHTTIPLGPFPSEQQHRERGRKKSGHPAQLRPFTFGQQASSASAPSEQKVTHSTSTAWGCAVPLIEGSLNRIFKQKLISLPFKNFLSLSQSPFQLAPISSESLCFV